MAGQNLQSAQLLLRSNKHRSCVSRAYYAAFAAATMEIRKVRQTFPRGYQHPPHDQMRKYLKQLKHLETTQRNDLRDALARLRLARLDADYRPRQPLDQNDARAAVRDAANVLQVLEIR